jgi:hypothetical protein
MQPRHAYGYKAKYDLRLYNRSMSNVTVGLSVNAEAKYCLPTFSPYPVYIEAGKSQAVKVRMQLPPKTPKEQKQQIQPFHLEINPVWMVNQVQMPTPMQTVEGEYHPRSRFYIFARHPFWSTLALIFLFIVLTWSFIIVPIIQTILASKLEEVHYSGNVANPIRVEQKVFSTSVDDLNPLKWVFLFKNVEVRFSEDDQKTRIVLKADFFGIKFEPGEMDGRVVLDSSTGDISFVPDNPDQLNQFPWFLLPPDTKVVKRLNVELKRWLKSQATPVHITRVEIEGNTLYLHNQNCQPNDSTCS